MNVLYYVAGIITGVLLFEYGLDYMKKTLGHVVHDAIDIQYDKCAPINKNNLRCHPFEESADVPVEHSTSETLEDVIERVEGFDSYTPPTPPSTEVDADGLFDYQPIIHDDNSVEYITDGREMDIQRQITLRGGM